MSKYVLFSFVGSSDPIRDCHDGPMLHIVRHYRPQKVMLFLSKEMVEREESDKMYSTAIESINEEIIVETIKSNIEDVTDYGLLAEEIPSLIEKLAEENKDSEILVNVSSGTLQMIGTINLHITTSNNFYRAIQVLTPEKRSNNSQVVSAKRCVKTDIDNNFDNDSDLETENRCREISLDSYRKTIINQQLKILVENYNYEAARLLIKENKTKYSDKIKNLIDHCRYRMLLNTEEANKYLPKEYSKNNIEEGNISRVVEYFNLLEIKQKNKRYSEFIIMLEPLAIEVAKLILKREYKINISKWYVKDNARMVIKEKIFRDNYKGLYDRIAREKVRYFEKGSVVSEFYFLLALIDLVVKDDLKLSDLFIKIKEVKKWRNLIAHDLFRVSPENVDFAHEVIKIFKEKIRENAPRNSKSLEVYDSLNKEIVGCLYD